MLRCYWMQFTVCFWTGRQNDTRICHTKGCSFGYIPSCRIDSGFVYSNANRIFNKYLLIISILSQELSDQENLSERAQLSEKDLLYDGGFDPNTLGAPKRFTCFVAAEQPANGRIVGFAMSFFKTFTAKRRTLFVDSLHVSCKSKMQRLYIERDLAETMCKFALKNGCFRVDLHVLQGSELAKMWKRMGAEDLTETMGMHHLRLHADAIEELVKM